MQKQNKSVLTEDPIIFSLIRLTVPMIFGILGMVLFNLIDTFFVSKIGTDELAALSFTFPVVLIINNIALGIGLGASVLISHAFGKKDYNEVKVITTDSLLLAFFIVIIFSFTGLLTIKPIFSLLGAKGSILDLIKQYMSVWYIGTMFVVVPMVGNNAIRGRGDSFIPGIMMFFASLLNFLLDPIFIFPQVNLHFIIIPGLNLGIRGAAIATVIARITTFTMALLVLGLKYKMLTLRIKSIKSIIVSWGQILYIAFPVAITRIIMPTVLGFITKLLAKYGKEHVAAFGVASRVEFFALSVIAALSIIIGPFVGQNLGAKKITRVIKGINFSNIFSMFWGFLIFILFRFLSYPILSIFNKDPLIILIGSNYLNIVPLSYGLFGIFFICSTSLNVLKKPYITLLLTFIIMICLCIPLAFIGSFLFQVVGIFAGIAISFSIGGLLSYLTIKYFLRKFRLSQK